MKHQATGNAGSDERHSRRRFLAVSLSVATAPQIIPASALGRGTQLAPSERITIGIRVRDAVRRYGCVFQIGTQQRSDAKFRHACKLARSGYLGKVHTISVGLDRNFAKC